MKTAALSYREGDKLFFCSLSDPGYPFKTFRKSISPTTRQKEDISSQEICLSFARLN